MGEVSHKLVAQLMDGFSRLEIEGLAQRVVWAAKHDRADMLRMLSDELKQAAWDYADNIEQGRRDPDQRASDRDI